MTRYDLQNGDSIKMYAWFGTFTMYVKTIKGTQVIATENNDIIMPLDKLATYSRASSSHSRWSFIARAKGIEDIEYVEVIEPKQNPINELKYFS